MADERESIWSVPKPAKRGYYICFSFLIIVSALILQGSIPPTIASPSDKWIWVLERMGPITIASAGLSLAAIEMGGVIGGSVMVLGSWIMEKWRERENRQFADKIDRVYGPETYKRLEQERQERESKGEDRHGENGSV